MEKTVPCSIWAYGAWGLKSAHCWGVPRTVVLPCFANRSLRSAHCWGVPRTVVLPIGLLDQFFPDQLTSPTTCAEDGCVSERFAIFPGQGLAYCVVLLASCVNRCMTLHNLFETKTASQQKGVGRVFTPLGTFYTISRASCSLYGGMLTYCHYSFYISYITYVLWDYDIMILLT